MSYCGTATLVKQKPRTAALRPLRCRSWSCEICAPDRRLRLIRETLGGQPTLFLTLTKRHVPDQTDKEAARAMVSAWRRLRLHLMRKYGFKHLPFMAVIEPHKSGKPHLHIFIRSRYIDINDIKAWTQKHLAAPIQDISKLNNKKAAAAYAAKYCTKNNRRFGTCKRYWKSRDYELDDRWRRKPERDPDQITEVTHDNIAVVIAAYERRGWLIEQLAPARYLATLPNWIQTQPMYPL